MNEYQIVRREEELSRKARPRDRCGARASAKTSLGARLWLQHKAESRAGYGYWSVL